MRLAKEGEEAHIEIDGKRYRIEPGDSTKRIIELSRLDGINLLVPEHKLSWVNWTKVSPGE